MSNKRDTDLRDDNNRECGENIQSRDQRFKRVGAGNGVDREPPDTRDESREAGRNEVSPFAERVSPENHLRQPRLGSPRGEDSVGNSREAVTDHDGENSLPNVEAEPDGQCADEHGGKLEVGRRPDGEQVPGLAVPLARWNGLDVIHFNG